VVIDQVYEKFNQPCKCKVNLRANDIQVYLGTDR